MSIERINSDLCNGCGICVDTCTMDCIRLDTVVADRSEYPHCRLACPAHVDMRRYIHFLKYGMIKEAMEVLRESLPLPAVTGHICPHPCETECSRNHVDYPLNINALERFVADHWMHEKAKPVKVLYSSKIAIIGSGPAGLSSAYFLAKLGYPVTVFEAQPMLGGMLRMGVPEFRLPVDVLDNQIKYIEDMGVTFKTNIIIGQDLSIEELFNAGYSAILISIGAQLSKKTDIQGSHFDGVSWGLEFLKDTKIKHQTSLLNKRVMVIGGGNVAISAALSALRLGAKDVQLACLEDKENMPACEVDIKQADEECITFNTSWGVKRILGDATKVTGVELARCKQLIDKQGLFNPQLDEQTTQIIGTDMVILAIGQTADFSLLPDSIQTTLNGTVKVHPITLETSHPGIFSCGDVASGPALVVDAFASGKEASISIDRFLRGEDLKAGRTAKPNQVVRPPLTGMEYLKRQETPVISLETRTRSFNEVRANLSEEVMTIEARRCMSCGSRAVIKYPEDCMLCIYCERDCPQKAIYVSPEKNIVPLLAWG